MLAPPEAPAPPAAPRRRGRRHRLVAVAAAVVVLAPLAWMWQASLLPDAYSAADMGFRDDGRAARREHGEHAGGGAASTR